jgi:hypothetical protein
MNMKKMSQHGGFDPVFEKLVRDELTAEFGESLDFARCQRPDGTFYGTGGQCRKGKEVGAKEVAKLKNAAKVGNKRAKLALDVVEGKKTKVQAQTELSKTKSTGAQKTTTEAEKSQKVAEPPKEVSSLEEAKANGWTITRETENFDPFEAFSTAGYELGTGLMGTAKLYGRENADVVKKGVIGEHEVEAMKRLQGLEIVPKLHGAATEPDSTALDPSIGSHVKTTNGIIGTARARGDSMAATYIDNDYESRAGVVDKYIQARRDIHLRGVAHNDMHAGNVFYAERSMAFERPRAEKGTMQVIDFGLAQIGYRAALLEAIHTTRNDFQATDFLGEYSPPKTRGDLAIDRLKKNEAGVIKKLETRGIKDPVLFGEIRSTPKEIDKMFGDLTEKEAERLLKELYKDV